MATMFPVKFPFSTLITVTRASVMLPVESVTALTTFA